MDVHGDTRELQPEAEVLVITGYGSVDSAVSAMKQGAYDYITKPVDPEELVRILHKAIELRSLRRQVVNLQDRLAREAGLDHIVAVSRSMKDLLQTIEKVASSDATVLIEGETGTGNELVARPIHTSGKGAGEPFVAITYPARNPRE